MAAPPFSVLNLAGRPLTESLRARYGIFDVEKPADFAICLEMMLVEQSWLAIQRLLVGEAIKASAAHVLLGVSLNSRTLAEALRHRNIEAYKLVTCRRSMEPSLVPWLRSRN
jgi:hypothetical protein